MCIYSTIGGRDRIPWLLADGWITINPKLNILLCPPKKVENALFASIYTENTSKFIQNVRRRKKQKWQDNCKEKTTTVFAHKLMLLSLWYLSDPETCTIFSKKKPHAFAFLKCIVCSLFTFIESSIIMGFSFEEISKFIGKNFLNCENNSDIST